MNGWSLGVIARKKSITTLALGLAVVSMVATVIVQSGGIMESSSKLAEKLVSPREKLLVSQNCTGHCIRQCIVTMNVRGENIETTLTVITGVHRLRGVPGKLENASIGILLSRETGIGKGKIVTVRVEDRIYMLHISSIHSTHSPLDLGLITSNDIPGCNQVKLATRKEGFEAYTRAFSRQVQGILWKWELAALLVLGLGSLIASAKAYMDLVKEKDIVYEEGARHGTLLAALSGYFAIAVFAGYAWGQIVTDVLNDLTATYTGLYVPRAFLTLEALAVQGLVPALLAGLISFLYGVSVASKNRIHNT